MDTYTCSICRETFAKCWSETEADAEYAETFPGMAGEPRAVVCDDCYRAMGFAAPELSS